MLAGITFLFILDLTQSSDTSDAIINTLPILNSGLKALSVDQAARMSRNRQMSHAERYETKIEILRNQITEKDATIAILNSSLIQIQTQLSQSKHNNNLGSNSVKWEHILGTFVMTVGIELICYAIWHICKHKKAERIHQGTHSSNAISMMPKKIESTPATKDKRLKQAETLQQMNEKLSNALFRGEKSENAMSHHFSQRQTFLRI